MVEAPAMACPFPIRADYAATAFPAITSLSSRATVSKILGATVVPGATRQTTRIRWPGAVPPEHGAVMDRTRQGDSVDHWDWQVPGFPQIQHTSPCTPLWVAQYAAAGPRGERTCTVAGSGAHP